MNTARWSRDERSDRGTERERERDRELGLLLVAIKHVQSITDDVYIRVIYAMTEVHG